MSERRCPSNDSSALTTSARNFRAEEYWQNILAFSEELERLGVSANRASEARKMQTSTLTAAAGKHGDEFGANIVKSVELLATKIVVLLHSVVSGSSVVQCQGCMQPFYFSFESDDVC